eukprot:SAG22_NODE_3291_length_1801_cov_21.342538_1_plen_42_part_10
MAFFCDGGLMNLMIQADEALLNCGHDTGLLLIGGGGGGGGGG